MFRKSIQIPVWLIAVMALALLSAGAFARTTAVVDDLFPALLLALPPGADHYGVDFVDLPASVAAAFGLNRPGVVVTRLQCGSLQTGDVITAINGESIESSRDLVAKAESLAAGSPLSLMVLRDGSQRLITVSRPSALPPSTEALLQLTTPPPLQGNPVQINPVQPEVIPGGIVGVIRGVQADTLTPKAIEQLGLSITTRGVIVTAVDSNTPAAMAGLRGTDVILEVNSTPVFNVLDFERAVAALGANSATLKVNRRGAILYIMIPAQ